MYIDFKKHCQDIISINGKIVWETKNLMEHEPFTETQKLELKEAIIERFAEIQCEVLRQLGI